MNRYNKEYYIMFMPKGDDQIYIKPQRRTAMRKYHYKKLIPGEEPLYFENSYRKEDNNKWPLTSVFVDSSGFLVTTRLYEKLRRYNISSMQRYPAIYIDDMGGYHEDYWYMGFYNSLDCLDIDKSEIEDLEFDEDDVSDDDETRLEVNRYFLDEDVLDNINEERRLLFKIDKCSKKYIFAHQKIVDILRGESGVNFIRVEDFEEGQQYL